MISLHDPGWCSPYVLAWPCHAPDPVFNQTTATALALTALGLIVGYLVGRNDRG